MHRTEVNKLASRRTRLTLGAWVYSLSIASALGQTTIFHGHELSYTVVDGLAVHDGDMILGTAEEASAAWRSKQRKSDDRIPARRISVENTQYLWPGGVVPYTIDSDFTAESLAVIQEGIDEWNSKTPISLVPRTTEPDYVRFRRGLRVPRQNSVTDLVNH